MKPSTANLGDFLVELMDKRIAFNLKMSNWDKYTATFTRSELRKICGVSRIEDNTIERMLEVIEAAQFVIENDTGRTFTVSFDPRAIFNSSTSLDNLISGNKAAERIEQVLLSTALIHKAILEEGSQTVNS